MRRKYEKRIINLIQLALIAFVSCGSAIGSTDEVVRKVISPMPNRVLEYYLNGEKIATEWDDSANLPVSIEGIIPDGVVVQRYDNGVLFIKMNFIKDKINGVTQFNCGNGGREAEVNYKNGQYDGHSKWLDCNGKIYFEYDVTDGVISNITNGDGKSIDIQTARANYNPFAFRYFSPVDIDQVSFKKTVANFLKLKKKPSLPEEARRYTVQADELSKISRYDEAIDLYEKALAVCPWWATGYYNRAFLLAEVKDYCWAVRDLQKYIALEPSAKDAREAQDQVYKWEALVDPGQSMFP